jgi:hypothetical protein
MALSRDQILSAPGKIETVRVEEWGGEVLLKPLSVSGLIGFMKRRESLEGPAVFALLISLCACDESGNPLFSAEDVDGLSDQSFELIQRVGTECLRINGMAPGQDEEAAKN